MNGRCQRSSQNIKGSETEVLFEIAHSSSLSFTGSLLSIPSAFGVLIVPKNLEPQTALHFFRLAKEEIKMYSISVSLHYLSQLKAGLWGPQLRMGYEIGAS